MTPYISFFLKWAVINFSNFRRCTNAIYVWNVHYSQPVKNLLVYYSLAPTYLHLPYLQGVTSCTFATYYHIVYQLLYLVVYQICAAITVLMLDHQISRKVTQSNYLEQRVVSSHRMVKANFEVIYAPSGIALSIITIFHQLSNSLKEARVPCLTMTHFWWPLGHNVTT